MKKIVFILSFVSLFLLLHINAQLIHAGDKKLGDECTTASDCAPNGDPKKDPQPECKKKGDNSVCYLQSSPPPCATLRQNPCASFDSGLGPLATDAGGFISTVFGIILAASGGIALLLIIRAGYKIMTSQGNPEAVKEGREQLIAAIVGLLFLIFSFVLLQLIGVDILRIPGL